MDKIRIQRSYEKEKPTLYIVATPIGNLGDITFRAIETLKKVDLIACEDTRVTRRLCQSFDIDKPLFQHHKHNIKSTIDALIQKMLNGQSIALVSDAGYPGISDPGEEIISAAIDNEIPVVVIPGASALLPALIGSGIKTQPFLYYGFLSNKRQQRLEEIEKLKYYRETLILYEAPHRIDETLNDLYLVLGNRRVSIARELTKRYETMIYGTLVELIQSQLSLKGEIVIVIEGDQAKDDRYENTVIDQVTIYVQQGMSNKEAIKRVAKERKMSKNEIYQLFHQAQSEK